MISDENTNRMLESSNSRFAVPLVLVFSKGDRATTMPMMSAPEQN